MTDDYTSANLKFAIVSCLDHTGKDTVRSSELKACMVEEKKWVTGEEFNNFLSECIRRDLLEVKMGNINIVFDRNDVMVPDNFAFRAGLLRSEKKLTPLQSIIQRITENTAITEDEIQGRIREIKEKMTIVTEVAALIVARENNIDVDDLLESAEKQIKRYAIEQHQDK